MWNSFTSCLVDITCILAKMHSVLTNASRSGVNNMEFNLIYFSFIQFTLDWLKVTLYQFIFSCVSNCLTCSFIFTWISLFILKRSFYFTLFFIYLFTIFDFLLRKRFEMQYGSTMYCIQQRILSWKFPKRYRLRVKKGLSLLLASFQPYDRLWAQWTYSPEINFAGLEKLKWRQAMRKL